MDSDLSNLTPPISQNEDENLKLAAELASANLLFAQTELGKRIIDPTITTKGLLDIAEHSYKVSGMAKKQEVKEDSGKFVFNIIYRNKDPLRIEKVVGGGTPDNDTPQSLLSQANKLVDVSNSLDLPDEAWV